MGTVISREQCPSCKDTSHDNLVEYDNGSKHCFACGHHENDRKEKVTIKNPNLITNGRYIELLNRGISRKTCEFFKYQVGETSGKKVHVANYCDKFGEVVAQKLRAAGKEMTITGQAKEMSLYGQWLWEPNDKIFVTVVEGEIDALSVAEVQGTRYPVVSIPNGCQGAKKALQKSLEWLSKWRHVVLCFDSDEAGQKAAKECADLFEPGKVKIAKLPLKDANEMLVAGRIGEIKDALWQAQDVRPDSIVGVEDILDKALERPSMGLSWPWPSLTSVTYGMRPRSIYCIGAGSGIGKSEFIKDILFHLTLEHGQKVGVFSFEQDPSETLLRMAGSVLNKRLHVPGSDWNEEEVKQAMRKFDGLTYFYDHYGANDMDTVAAKIRFLVKGLGCRYLVVDPFTAVAAHMADERRGIDAAMAAFGSLVQELDCTLFLVSHLAKPAEGRTYEEGRPVTPAAFRGSQSIQYWSHFLIGLERNKLAEDPNARKVTTVRILKDRFSGEADGVTVRLKYDVSIGRLVEDIDIDIEESYTETKTKESRVI